MLSIADFTLTPEQADFLTLPGRHRLFVAGRGAGKTHALAVDLALRAARRSGLYLALAPTHLTAGLFRDRVWAVLGGLTHPGPAPRIVHHARPAIAFGESRIEFRSSDAVGWPAHNYAGAAIDELDAVLRYAEPLFMETLLACLPPPAGVAAAFTPEPAGKPHLPGRWLSVTAPTRSNPFISQEHVARMESTHPGETLADLPPSRRPTPP